MSLRNVILGYLEQPASGYDIKQAFDRHLSHLWVAETSQIYGTLRTMEKDGLLSSAKQKSEKGPDRRVYSRTPLGDDAFSTWLEGDPELSRERLSILSQIHFMSRSRDPLQTRAFLIRLRERFAERLEQYETMRREESASDDALLDNLALDLGLETMRARLSWCEQTIRKLSELDGGATSRA